MDRERQFRIQKRPRWGTEAANLFGGGLLHRGGLGSGEQITIYAFHLYFPVRPRNAVKRSNLPLRKWPRSASQHRSHRSPPNRDLRIGAVGSRAMLSLLRRPLKDAKEIVWLRRVKNPSQARPVYLN